MGITKGTYRKDIWDKARGKLPTLFFRTIGFIHNRVHEGDYFTTGHTFEAVSSGSKATVLLRVGSLPAHISIASSSGGDSYGSLYEGGSFTDFGTEIAVVNHNRHNVKTAETIAYHTPTIDTYGMVLFENEYMPGGNKSQNFFGASSANREEWVLNPNTDYLVEVTNKSASEDIVSIIASFYEKMFS